MSSYMVYNKSISQIADLVASVLNAGYNSTALSASDKLYEAFNDCYITGFANREKVFEKLYNLNLSAVNSRYCEADSAIDTYTDCQLWTKPNYKFHWICEANHYQMLKTLQCFIYQCSEDINRNNPILAGLEQLEQSIKNLIISSLDLYNEAKWQ